MLGKAAVLGLGIRKSEIVPCLFQIKTSLGGTGSRNFMTRDDLVVRVNPDHEKDSSSLRAKAVVTGAESYDVLVGGSVLYPMGFTLDYWEESASYRPGWQSGDGRVSRLPVRFIGSVGKSSSSTMATVAAFSSVVDCSVVDELEAVPSMGTLPCCELEVPLWTLVDALPRGMDALVEDSSCEEFELSGVVLSPLGLLELFGGSAIQGYHRVLSFDISMLGAQEFTRFGDVNLDVADCPCKGRLGRGNWLTNSRSGLFWFIGVG